MQRAHKPGRLQYLLDSLLRRTPVPMRRRAVAVRRRARESTHLQKLLSRFGRQAKSLSLCVCVCVCVCVCTLHILHTHTHTHTHIPVPNEDPDFTQTPDAEMQPHLARAVCCPCTFQGMLHPGPTSGRRHRSQRRPAPRAPLEIGHQTVGICNGHAARHPGKSPRTCRRVGLFLAADRTACPDPQFGPRTCTGET